MRLRPWVWGYGPNKDCNEGDFKAGEGCCWLKCPSDDGSKCTQDKRPSKTQSMGFTVDTASDTALPGAGPSGWFIVITICMSLFAGSAYGRVSPGFGRNLTGLVHDGIVFWMSATGYSHPIRPVKRGDYSAVNSEAGPASSAAAAAGGGGGVGPAAGAASSATGERTALHAAAAVGDLVWLQGTPHRHALSGTPLSDLTPPLAIILCHNRH